jgi:hypothetical protein
MLGPGRSSFVQEWLFIVPDGASLQDMTAWLLTRAGVAAACSAVTVALGAPPWLIVVTCLCHTALGVVQAVVPQESPDRLAWWRERRRKEPRR